MMDMKMISMKRPIGMLLTSAVLSFTLVGCGENRSDEEPVESLGALLADFEASRTSVPAGVAVLFDARASQGEGRLIYSWDFGNGRLGGTEQIPQIFHKPGSYQVKLTVVDEMGRRSTAERTIEVTPGPSVLGDLDLNVQVVGLDGEQRSEVAIEVIGHEGSWVSDPQGHVTLEGLAYDMDLVIRLEKQGYAPQVIRRRFEREDKPVLEAVLIPITERVVLANAEIGGEVRSVDGARVLFPPAAIVDREGNAVRGPVDVDFTVLDVSERLDAFPGGFDAVNAEGLEGLLITFGVMDVTLRQNGELVQIAPGQMAEIEIPMFIEGHAPERAIPLWSLDEQSGVWIQEGMGETVASKDSPTGIALRGEVGHFTWWNADVWANTPCALEFIPTCTDDEGNEVEVPGSFSARANLSMAPAPGFNDACVPSQHLRHSDYNAHPTFRDWPSGDSIEGTFCTNRTGFYPPATEALLQCRNESGSIPADVYCKEDRFGRDNSIFVGVCTSINDSCGPYMYCEPTGGGAGRCTPPFYRFSDLDGTRVSLFSNWDGWQGNLDRSFDASVSRKLYNMARVPYAPLSVEFQNVQAPEIDVKSGPITGNIRPIGPNNVEITDPWNADGLQSAGNAAGGFPLQPPYWSCTPEPTRVNVGLCLSEEEEEECTPESPNYPECCDEPGNEGVCDPDPEPCTVTSDAYPECCEEPGNEELEECKSGEIVIECNPTVPLGVNDITGFCEIDAIIVNRTEGILTEPLFIRDTEVDMNITPASDRGVAEPETLRSVNFNTCEPGNPIGDGWKPHVGYIRSRLLVEFTGELKSGDVVRIFRQGVPANEMNDEGQNCAASGTISVRLPGSDNYLVQDIYNSFEVRIRDHHLPSD